LNVLNPIGRRFRYNLKDKYIKHPGPASGFIIILNIYKTRNRDNVIADSNYFKNSTFALIRLIKDEIGCAGR